jgi:hypothetical protein
VILNKNIIAERNNSGSQKNRSNGWQTSSCDNEHVMEQWRNCWMRSKAKVKVMLWLMVIQPVYPGVKHPSGAQDQIFVTVRQLRVCWCGAPSLTRGRVCCLQPLLVLTSAVILGSQSQGTHDHILLSQIRDSLNLEGQAPVFISYRNKGGPVISPGTGIHFAPSYDFQGYGGGIGNHRHTGYWLLWGARAIAIC